MFVGKSYTGGFAVPIPFAFIKVVFGRIFGFGLSDRVDRAVNAYRIVQRRRLVDLETEFRVRIGTVLDEYDATVLIGDRYRVKLARLQRDVCDLDRRFGLIDEHFYRAVVDVFCCRDERLFKESLFSV